MEIVDKYYVHFVRHFYCLYDNIIVPLCHEYCYSYSGYFTNIVVFFFNIIKQLQHFKSGAIQISSQNDGSKENHDGEKVRTNGNSTEAAKIHCYANYLLPCYVLFYEGKKAIPQHIVLINTWS